MSDPIFYHLKLRRYVVVELKAVPFDAGFVGTLKIFRMPTLTKIHTDRAEITVQICACRHVMCSKRIHEQM